MSVNYALGLSTYEFKGKCGMKETFDPENVINENCLKLAQLLQNSKHTVVITGAGISTAAGIPDFRGPKGVWTLEEQGLMPEVSINFETAKPTLAHMALVSLEAHGFIKHLISQNVDGLHLRSGFPRNKLSELHGNMFMEECDLCHGQFFGKNTVPTMGLKHTGSSCTRNKTWGRCRGKLKDTILDWEDELPIAELNKSEDQCKMADLCICLGTSLQIQPCGNMPILTKKRGGNVVIVSLQPTRHDKHANIKLQAYVDDVLKKACDHLSIGIAEWMAPTFVLKSRHIDNARSSKYISVDDSYLRSINIPPHQLSNQSQVNLSSITDECPAFNQGSIKPLLGVKRKNKKTFDSILEINGPKVTCNNNCTSDGILDTIDTQFGYDEISQDELDCCDNTVNNLGNFKTRVNKKYIKYENSFSNGFHNNNLVINNDSIIATGLTDISVELKTDDCCILNHGHIRSSHRSKLYNRKNKKKEKSTDCDSALIPLHCVHG